MTELSVLRPDPARGRLYITPEDVSDALRLGEMPSAVALDVLRVIGKQTSCGIEDASLCAFIAARALERAL